MGSSGSKSSVPSAVTAPRRLRPEDEPSEEENFEKERLLDVLRNDDWRTSSTVPWHTIQNINFADIEFYVRLSQDDVEHILSQCGGNLKELVLSTVCDSSIMSTVNEFCPNLEYLEFTLKTIKEEDFLGAFSNLTNLKVLVTRSGYITDRRETLVNLTEIVSSLHPEKLEELAFLPDKSTIMAPPVLHQFPSSLERFTALKKLTLRIFELSADDVAVISKTETLESLEMMSCSFTEGTTFKLELPRLERLQFCGMEDLNDCLTSLSSHSAKLKEVEMISCRGLSPEALRALSSLGNLKKLTLQRIEGLDEEFMGSVANSCGKTLEYLDISHCPGVEREALGHLAKLENLVYLDLRCVDSLDGNALTGVANHCRKLQHLCLARCTNVPETAFRELNKLEDLEILVIVDIDEVGDSTFMRMHKLRVLECGRCPKITDTSMMRIIKNAPNLESLLPYETDVTVKTLMFAAKETKKRTNNVVLEITVDRPVVERFIRSNTRPGPLLRLIPREKRYPCGCERRNCDH